MHKAVRSCAAGECDRYRVIASKRKTSSNNPALIFNENREDNSTDHNIGIGEDMEKKRRYEVVYEVITVLAQQPINFGWKLSLVAFIVDTLPNTLQKTLQIHSPTEPHESPDVDLLRKQTKKVTACVTLTRATSQL